MARIVLATFGSLGDVHPFLALGKALQARSHEVMLAAPPAYLDLVRAAGLGAASIFPDFHEVTQRLRCTTEAVVRRMMKSPNFSIQEFLLPSLAGSCEALLKVANGAAAVVGQFLALAAPIVAEKLRVPFIPAHLHPMAFLSAGDPPAGPPFRMLAPSPRWSLPRLWNRAWIAAIRHDLRRRYAAPVNRVRAAYGLPPLARSPLFEEVGQPFPLVLGLYSRVLGEPQADFPANTHLVGFALYDGADSGQQAVTEDLRRFLDAGPPPLVFTLGSLAVLAPGNFYSESLEAARMLGRRAVLLTGLERNDPAADETAFVCRYAPHAAVFPKAVAVVHHGGVGTMGQALRAGVPQLVVPHLGDQWDNAARAERLGVSRTLDSRRYTAKRAAPLLAALLSGPSIADRAARLRRVVAAEDGARAGAEHIDGLLARTVCNGAADRLS
jgi:UDP:flavonoid glycosyltransferase YjiC (YdhE family)